MEYLEFIFQDWYHLIGTLLLCGSVFGGLGRMFSKKTENHYHSNKEAGTGSDPF